MTSIIEWTGMRYEDLVRLAQDRERWRVMTANLLQELEDGSNPDRRRAKRCPSGLEHWTGDRVVLGSNHYRIVYFYARMWEM